jgi:hypothetical protein
MKEEKKKLSKKDYYSHKLQEEELKEKVKSALAELKKFRGVA